MFEKQLRTQSEVAMKVAMEVEMKVAMEVEMKVAMEVEILALTPKQFLMVENYHSSGCNCSDI